MKIKPSFKLPITISFILHLLIFSLLFIHFMPVNNPVTSQTKVVHAVAVAEKQVSVKPSTAPPNVVPPNPESFVSKAQSLPPKTIRQIEQTTLRQTEIHKKIPSEVKSKPSAQPREMVMPEEAIELQTPKLSEKIVQQKKAEEKKKADLRKKEKELVRKHKAEEARQLLLAKKQHEEQLKALEQEIKSEAESDTKVTHEQPTNKEQEDLADTALNAQKKELSASKAQAGNEVDKYKQMIIQTISRKWLMPETQNKELACQLLVHVGPGGIVVSVDVLKESGDANLDRSARNAIIKASPLPVPEESELFDNFRALRLTFRPQGIISE